ncbi:MAG: hypothetical protein U0903_07435 [Planctomycetales bacterium]
MRVGKEQSFDMDLYNQGVIALAFAVLKMCWGSCPVDVKEIAVDALKRTAILLEGGRLNEEIRAECDAQIRRMTSKLAVIAGL